MPHKHQVYLLDPQSLRPETIAVTFAKTSRSPESFRDIAAELTDDRSAQFHEKWVVGYGHSSVAEHAVLHIACENISRLAVETLEGNRLASYTEKSSRYQAWDVDSFIIPPELEGHSLRSEYVDTCQLLLNTYQQMLPQVQKAVQAEHPRQHGETEAAWDRRLRTEFIDVCRFLLPAASLANVGVTINARALEYAVSKMLSHPLAEVRNLGEEVKSVAQAEVPTLVKYAHPIQAEEKLRQAFTAELPSSQPSDGSSDWCSLIVRDDEAEVRILTALFFRFFNLGYAQALDLVRSSPLPVRQQLARTLFSSLDRHDVPPRELEHSLATFELTLDQGAYYELKRHRMLTLTPQPLTALLGFAIPRLITAAGVESTYRSAMLQARQAYLHLADWNPEVAAYLVPNGFNRRVLFSLNLRSADHLLQLRTAPNAHFSIRRIAQRMAEQLREAFPLLGGLLRADPAETWQQIERDHFSESACL